jgi:GGDEF domain-containing protein
VTDLPADLVLALKAGSGPLVEALALALLGVWLGVRRRDLLARWTVTGGVVVLALCGVVLLVGPFVVPGVAPHSWLEASAIVDGVGVVLAALACTRAGRIGDSLAWWMLGACGLLAAAVAGLHVHVFDSALLGNAAQFAVAATACGYMMAVTWLVNLRLEQTRRLAQALRAGDGRDPLTKLPQGAALLDLTADALRRSVRLKRECAIIAVSVPNLYDLNGEAGYDIDHDVAVLLSARIQSVVGVHDDVGIYHPSCFVVAVPAVQSARTMRAIGLRIASELRQPLPVQTGSGETLTFRPDVGVGVVRIASSISDVSLTLEDAEALAGIARNYRSRAAIREVSEKAPSPLDAYKFPPPRERATVRDSASPMTRI